MAEHAMHSVAGEKPGWWRYFTFNTDHKVIGLQYMAAANVFLVLGVALAMIIRAELLRPGMQVVDPQTYNGIMTLHGTTMIFLWVIPILTGVANYILPLQIGAEDMAFPRLNAASFWIFLPGAILVVAGFLVGPAAAGWTSYTPLAQQGAMGQNLWIIGLILTGSSSIMGGLNFLATALTMRAKGMGIWQTPLFVWAVVATSILILMGTPVLTSGLFLQLFDRILGTAFFQPSAGGNPILWQHLFWFYSHPAVYIMVLPAFGVVSEVYPVFARKPIFGYHVIAGSSIAIAVLSLTVWAHHMFTSGAAPITLFPQMLTSMLIAVPTGVKVFSWLATLWNGKLRFNAPMLFALGMISQFLIAGITGIMQASIPLDLHFQDTYFLVAHLHYALFGSAVFGLIAGVYYWFPKITGRMYNEGIARVHFALAFLGFNGVFLPMFWLGLNGMPRRVADYIPEFGGVNAFISIVAFMLGFSFLLFWFNLVYSWIRGPVAGPNPWRAMTLEWSTSSPPPPHNFDHEPVWSGDPYGYGTDQARPATTKPVSRPTA